MLLEAASVKIAKIQVTPEESAHSCQQRKKERGESCCGRTAGSTRSCVRMSDKLVYLIYLKPDVLMNYLLNFCCFAVKFPWFSIHSQNWFELNRFIEREKQPRSLAKQRTVYKVYRTRLGKRKCRQNIRQDGKNNSFPVIHKVSKVDTIASHIYFGSKYHVHVKNKFASKMIQLVTITNLFLFEVVHCQLCALRETSKGPAWILSSWTKLSKENEPFWPKAWTMVNRASHVTIYSYMFLCNYV